MTTKQTDTPALTDEQLEGVAGGIILHSPRPVHIQEACANGTFYFKRPGNMKRRSNRTFSYTECDENGS